MLCGRPNTFLWKYNNYGAANVTPGTSLTPAGSNNESAWAQIASAANIPYDVWALSLHFYTGSTAGVNHRYVSDIGIDPAGGTAYVQLLTDIIHGQPCAASLGGLGRMYYFPIRIPAGSSVAWRVKGSNASVTANRLMARFAGRPTNPGSIRRGSYFVGTPVMASVSGVALTPGSSGTPGAWVSLGTLSRPAWWHQVGVQINNTALTAGVCRIDLAHGDASNKSFISQNTVMSLSGNEYMGADVPVWAEVDLPAGAELFARGTFGGTPNTGYSAACVSVGGDA